MVEAGLFVSRRIELLNGCVIEMLPEGPEHADLATDADELFARVARGRYRVRVAKPITIEATSSEPEPDIALVKPQSYRQRHPIPAEVFLIVEFAKSSLAKDTEEKRKVYAAAGIQDYWVVNLQLGEVLVYRQPVTGDYQSIEALRAGHIIPLVFPDVELDVATLLP
jgi:Uma2 family endonuclease